MIITIDELEKYISYIKQEKDNGYPEWAYEEPLNDLLDFIKSMDKNNKGD